MTICSWIAIPVPGGIVMTLQTLAVSVCGYFLGVPSAVASLGCYLAVGIVGIPVFSGFSVGIGVLIGPTGGFLYGFFAIAVLCGRASGKSKMVVRILLGFAGLVICHICGIVHFVLVTDADFRASALAVSLPYIIKDAISVVLAQWLAQKLNRTVLKF